MLMNINKTGSSAETTIENNLQIFILADVSGIGLPAVLA